MLDMMTAYASNALVFLCLALIQFAGLATRRFGAWLGWWAGSNLLFGIGTMLVAFRTRIPDWLSIDVANPIIMLAYLALVAGIRSFAGRRPDWLLLGTVLTVQTALIVGFHGPEHFAFRVVVASSCCAICDGLVVAEAWRMRRDEKLASATLIAGLFAWTGTAFALRAGLAAGGWIGPDALSSGNALNSWMTVSAGIFVLARGVALLFLVAERQENSLRALAWSDPLTGALNRIGLERGFAVLRQPRPAEVPSVAVLLVDLDHFKAINDSCGHALGDAMLCALARAARECLPAGALTARYGGDEFVVVIPGCGPREAEHWAHALRSAFADALESNSGTAGFTATVSIGAASGSGAELQLKELILKADKALYRAKALGRDRVSSAPWLQVA